jgi:V8-like Glu-specific endopeptidase
MQIAWELEDQEAGGVITHPTLGVGRIVSDEAGFDEFEGEEEVIGTDERIFVSDTKKAPYRWVCSLDLYFQDPDDAKQVLLHHGSGTLIGEKHVLTCGHCLLNDMKGSKGTVKKLKPMKIMVTPGRCGIGTTDATKAPWGYSQAASFKPSPEWEKRYDPQYDFGLITLMLPLGKDPVGYWGSRKSGQGTQIDVISPKKMTGQPMNVSGYPADKCRDRPATGSASEADIKACAVPDWASTQWRSSGKVTDSTPVDYPNLIYFDADTYEGHSGGPVWFYYAKGSKRNMIAINSGYLSAFKLNCGVRITKDVMNAVRKLM